MRIRTDGEYAHRQEQIEDTSELLGCNKTSAVLIACDHIQEDIDRKRQAINYASKHLPPEQAEEIANILTTRHVSVVYDPPETDAEISD